MPKPAQRTTPSSPSPPTTTREERNDKRPAASFKYGVAGGIIEAAVWTKEMKSDSGNDFLVYNVQVSRSYKDDNGWQSTNSVRGSDVPVLIHALQKAYDFILEDRAAQAAS